MSHSSQYLSPQTLVAERPARLVFKPITFADIPLLRPYLMQSGSRSCDFTVGGVFMWIAYFGYEYCIWRDTLFIKGLSEDATRRTAFSLPMGALPLPQAVAAVKAYCSQKGLTPLFSAIPEEYIDAFKALGATAVEPLDSWADYIYDSHDLATLAGKRYNKKRNHVNRFEADNPGWRLDDIDSGNIDELRTFFAALDIASEKADPAMAEYEREQCLEVLDNYSLFGFEGALLRDGNGRIVAFTAAEPVGDTLVIHIEKMLHDVAGAGEAVNRFFAERMLERHPQLKYFNREDDAGDPGLRYAKESYHPAFLLHKYNVVM